MGLWSPSAVLADDAAPAVDPVLEDAVITLSRCVAAEVGPDVAGPGNDARVAEQMSVLWSLHNGWQSRHRNRPAETLAAFARSYCRWWRDPGSQRRRPWIGELPANGRTKPPSWRVEREHERWAAYRPRWAALLARVRAWLGPCGAALVLHWNSPGSKPRGRMRQSACFVAEGRNVFFEVDP